MTEIEAQFVRVLLLAREMGALQMGAAALEGAKLHAHRARLQDARRKRQGAANRHSALSYEKAGAIPTMVAFTAA